MVHGHPQITSEELLLDTPARVHVVAQEDKGVQTLPGVRCRGAC